MMKFCKLLFWLLLPSSGFILYSQKCLPFLMILLFQHVSCKFWMTEVVVKLERKLLNKVMLLFFLHLHSNWEVVMVWLVLVGMNHYGEGYNSFMMFKITSSLNVLNLILRRRVKNTFAFFPQSYFSCISGFLWMCWRPWNGKGTQSINTSTTFQFNEKDLKVF